MNDIELNKLLSTEFIDTFPAFLDSLIDDNTKKEYTTIVNRFADFLQKDVLEANRQNCLDFLKHLKENGLQERTVHKYYATLNSVFNFMKSYSLIETNVFAQINHKSPEKNIQKIISRSDLNKLIDYLSKNDLMCLTAVLLSVKTLLTKSQFLSLKVLDLNLQEKYVYVHTKYKTIINELTDDMIPYIDTYVSNLSDRSIYLFPSSYAPYGCISSKQILNRLHKACKAAGAEKCTFNDLRNTGTAASVANGATAEMIVDAVDLKSYQHVDRLTNIKPLKIKQPNKIAEFIHIQD